MPDPWYPAALRDPGVAAGYGRGRTRMRTVKCHYTVGTNSGALIRNQGLAQWLVSRDGTVLQYAEADALCWDSGEWNDDGPGIEVEYYQPQDGDEIFTPAARTATAGLVQWLHTEWGIPLEYYDGPRIPESQGYRGFIAHGSLIQTQQHYDYWPRADWDAMVNPAPAPKPTRRPQKMIIVNTDDKGFFTYTPELGHFQPVDSATALYLMETGLPNVKVPWATCVEWAENAEKRIKALKA